MTNQLTDQTIADQSEQAFPAISLNETLAGELNDLLQLNLDGQNGYEAAANDLKNEEYKALLTQYAQERRAHAETLSHLLRANNFTPEKTSSLSGALHEGWMNLRAALSSSDVSVFADCERADEVTLTTYQEMIGRTTDEPVLELLRQQFTNIRNAYERVKALRGALEQAARLEAE